jgi:hypothetical protein
MLNISVLNTFFSIAARFNYLFINFIQFFFNESNTIYSSFYFASYLLMKETHTRHINVGVLVLLIILIALNWYSNKFLNSIFAAAISLEFIYYFSASIVYAKKNPKNLDLCNCFDYYIQGALFFILLIFDIVHFYEKKSIILVIIASLLPMYDKLKVMILMLFVLDFVFYMFQIPYYKERMPYTVYTTILYAFAFIIFFDILYNIRKKYF